MPAQSLFLLAFVALTLALALAQNPTNPPPGALIKVTANGEIGIYLEEFPKETVSRVIDFAKDQDDDYWREAVIRQIWLTSYRLIFRPYYYPDPGTLYGQLPIPMDQLDITFDSKPKKDTVFGKSVISRKYKLESYIVADVNSTLRSDPNFANIGGTVIESFFLPLDPYLLVQRTGYDCMGEGGFPLNSVDPENPEYFYDDSCGPEEPYDPSAPCGQCHCTFSSSTSCVDSLKKNIGRVKVDIKFKRVAWDDRLVRRIEAQAPYNITSSLGADIRPSIPDLNHNYVTYQYVEPDSCTMKECGEAPGWRRHLNFDAQNVNVGLKPLEIGYISYEAQDASSFDPLAFHNLYYWDTCHQHPHFSAYATFQFGQNAGRKQGFCIQTTGRTLNTRWSPLVTDSWTCSYQGIETGWNDAYNAGIPCQWVDVTSVNTNNGPVTKALTLTSNPKNWLCEGVVRRDSNGNPLWVPTGEFTATGQSIDKYNCQDTPGALTNNVASVQATIPVKGGGVITSKCIHKKHYLGPKRDCEFNIRSQMDRCTPGATVKLRCKSPKNKPSQVIRFCESSKALNAGLACRYLDSHTLANVVLEPGVDTKVTFKCPVARDAVETGGYYSTYSGPVFNAGDNAAEIDCDVI